MGLFSRIKEGLEAVEQLQMAGSLGMVPVPGEATLELPAGTIAVSLDMTEPSVGTSEDDEEFWRRPEIDLTVTGPGGQVPFVPGDKVAVSGHDENRRRRSTWGSLAVSQAGAHRVTATARRDWYARPGVEPRVLFDAR